MSGALLDVRVEGPRTRLRAAREADAPRLFALLHRNERVLRGMLVEGPEREADVAARCAHWCTPDPGGDPYLADLLLVLEDRADDAPVGALTLTREGSRTTARLGYWVHDSRWGRGLATDAVRLAAELARLELRVPVLVAEVFQGEHASRRVLEKAGFQLDPAAPPTSLPARTGPDPADRREQPLWCFTATAADLRQARANAAWSPTSWHVARAALHP